MGISATHMLPKIGFSTKINTPSGKTRRVGVVKQSPHAFYGNFLKAFCL